MRILNELLFSAKSCKNAILITCCLLCMVGCNKKIDSKSPKKELKIDRPDVVIIIIDAARADVMSIYNPKAKTTPYLADIGKNSTVFDSCRVNGLWTRASVPSILTGLYVSSHGQTQGGVEERYFDILSENTMTLPDYFHSAGYNTSLYTYMGWYAKSFGFQQGFDNTMVGEDLTAYRENHEENVSEEPYGIKCRNNDRASLEALLDTARSPKDPKTPQFSFIHLTGVHSPLNLPLDQLGNYVQVKEYESYLQELGVDFSLSSGQHIIMRDNEAFRDFYFRLYLEVFEYVDQLVADFIERYTQLRPNTIFVITADHGEMFMEKYAEHLHGEYVTPFEELVHIPLIFYWPGRVPEQRIATPAMSVDILPTLLNLCDIDYNSNNLDGKSLSDLIIQREEVDPQLETRYCLSEGGYEYLSYAVTQGEYKYIRVHPSNEVSLWQINRLKDPILFFNLSENEENNLFYQHQQTAMDFETYANTILLRRKGFHLVFIGEGQVQSYEGSIQADSPVDRCSIRYNHEESFYDLKTALHPESNRFFRGKIQKSGKSTQTSIDKDSQSIILAPHDEMEFLIDTRNLFGTPPGKPVVFTFGFQFAANQQNSMVDVKVSSPGNMKESKFTQTDKPETWFVRDYLAIADSPLYINLKNPSDQTATLNQCFVSPNELSTKANRYDNNTLHFKFRLGDGKVDLNWNHENLPLEIEFKLVTPSKVPFYIWEGDKFRQKDHNSLFEQEAIIRAAVMDSPQNIVKAIQTAVIKERSGTYFYRVGHPSNSRRMGEDGVLELDEKALKDLEAMGYL